MTHDHEEQSVMRALWAIIWRSIVFAPIMALIGVPLLAAGLSLFVLPLFAVIYAFGHLWDHAFYCVAVWLLLCCIWRLFRLRRFFEGPPNSPHEWI